MFAINYTPGFKIEGDYENIDAAVLDGVPSGKYIVINSGGMIYGLFPGMIMQIP